MQTLAGFVCLLHVLGPAVLVSDNGYVIIVYLTQQSGAALSVLSPSASEHSVRHDGKHLHIFQSQILATVFEESGSESLTGFLLDNVCRAFEGKHRL